VNQQNTIFYYVYILLCVYKKMSFVSTEIEAEGIFHRPRDTHSTWKGIRTRECVGAGF
jgi:hypothetical protein